ncbi:hypothetical protein JCGZ_10201 [Jatropha curcas]|uniref:Phytocyanin domain-containing protein n=1 Tax=Jatropha curcas TaxID=180498 RepID=A0A067LD03_JATCU|nr:mavicyanin [Jatropha curcas]KDP46361.1 hypothetical protein JCGZ_10201 [Jatropha curcas]
MASSSFSYTKLMLLLSIFSSLHYFSVFSFEFKVGGNRGWVIPPENDTKIYNDWASENRFQIGDTVRFRYEKDSVLKVTEEEYKKCNSSHPSFFSDTGNTVYKFEHAGPFYFISGVSGHCEKGQRIIIKVMAHEEDYTSHHGHGDDAGKKSAASPPTVLHFAALPKVAFLQLLMTSYVVSCVF